MITFGNIQFSGTPTKTGRQLVYVDIIRNGVTYNWKVYTPSLNGTSLMDYLTTNANVYEQDIIRKEALWLTVPHTRIIDGIEVPIDKTEVVCATVPDYEELNFEPVLDIKAIKRLLISLTSTILSSETITQQQIDDLAMIHPYFQVGTSYSVGNVFSYEGKLYEVIQAHTSQADWLPDLVPAVYKVKTPAGTIAEWVQPLGAQDSYQTGDKVTHNGHTWESTVDNNVWEPGVYGWTQL